MYYKVGNEAKFHIGLKKPLMMLHISIETCRDKRMTVF